jgi:hypothetical protein
VDTLVESAIRSERERSDPRREVNDVIESRRSLRNQRSLRRVESEDTVSLRSLRNQRREDVNLSAVQLHEDLVVNQDDLPLCVLPIKQVERNAESHTKKERVNDEEVMNMHITTSMPPGDMNSLSARSKR